MNGSAETNLTPIREAMARFEISPRVEPNEEIDLERVFFPDGHRGVLDTRRQLVVGNRGMGKSFWTHALTNYDVRRQLARTYSFPKLATTEVIIGFNGSTKLSGIAPTIEEIQAARRFGDDPELIWRAVILRAARSRRPGGSAPNLVQASSLAEALKEMKDRPSEYAQELTAVDEEISRDGSSMLIVFDALDRLDHTWGPIRELTRGLLVTALGLQSFRGIRAKVFLRVDQFADQELFRFPDSSKLRNDRVDLLWKAQELYGLLLFELLREPAAGAVLRGLAKRLNVESDLPAGGRLDPAAQNQEALVTSMGGEYMGRDRKRGRVYTWVPLHLGDAANNCSPRTFLTAWKTAAEHAPPPKGLAVDYLGLNEGVRRASSARLTELKEDYPWIDRALQPLHRQFVPIQKAELFRLWAEAEVTKRILEQTKSEGVLGPIGMFLENNQEALLETMAQIAVMEQRANGKINVPDIFRVEAQILRKGGVAVPRRN